MSTKSKLTVVVPCYNESSAIPTFINEAKRFHEEFVINFPDDELSFLIIDNNSVDDSFNLLNNLTSEKNSIFSVSKHEVQGYGAVLKYGFKLASRDSKYIGFLDLDNTYPLNDLNVMLKKLKSENSDMVFGARLHKSSKIDFVRHLGNYLYAITLKLFCKTILTDVCSGMRIFVNSRTLEVIQLKRNDLSFSIEFTAHSIVNNWKIIEVPISYRERIGRSKLNVFLDGFKFLFVLINKVLLSKYKK